VGRLTGASVGGGGGYRGTDRRSTTADPPAVGDRSWLVGGVALSVLLVAASWMSFGGDIEPTRLALRSGAAMMAIVLAVASHLYWRATGQASGYLVSTAGWLVAASMFLKLAMPMPPPSSAALGSMPLLLAAIWVGRAVIAPEVDTNSGPVREASIAAAALTASWAVALGAVTVVDVAPTSLVHVTHVVTVVTWGAVTVVGLVHAVRGTTILRAWIAWMAAAFTLSSLASLLSTVWGDPWLPLTAALRVNALLVAAIGVAYGLSRSTLARRDDLYREAVRHREQQRQRGDEGRELVHEIRIALFAIEGATRPLGEQSDDLDAEQREQLDAVLRSGIDHLRRLVDAAPSDGPVRRARDLVEERATLARGRGALEVSVHGDPHLLVAAEAGALTQVLDNLLANAERHAARQARATVRIDLAGGDRMLRMFVADDGPGIPKGAQARVFERGVQVDGGSEGDGLGLHVARRLLRELGGDLNLVPSTRGACFEVRLPLRTISSETAHEPDEGGEVLQISDPVAGGSMDRSPTSRRRRVIQYHRELGSRLRRAVRDDRQVEDVPGVLLGQDDAHVGQHVLQVTAERIEQQRRRR
jgi:signal transduction histidine kinase